MLIYFPEQEDVTTDDDAQISEQKFKVIIAVVRNQICFFPRKY